MDRTILHCDCNGFYASVECAENPALAALPMAVGGSRETRHGIILAKNEAAKRFGIVTAETVGSALAKCPDLVIVPPRHALYEAYSERVNAIYEEYTDQVEKFGIDESWLDVTASYRLFGSGRAIADILRSRVKKEIGITISVGVSFNKVFAKLGSDLKKPDATTVICRSDVAHKVAPLPAEMLLFVGHNTALALARMGLHTIGDIALAGEAVLTARFGKQGTQIYRYAAGLDDSPVASVTEQHKVKSVGNGMTFPVDLVDEEDIRKALYALSDTVAWRLRKSHLRCKTLQLTIRDPAFHTITRQTTITPTNAAHDLTISALRLLGDRWTIGQPIRMLTVTAQQVIDEDAPIQLSLFSEPQDIDKHEAVEAAIDEIREKFGSSSVVRARQMRKQKR